MLLVQCAYTRDWPGHQDTWGFQLQLCSNHVTSGEGHFPSPGLMPPISVVQAGLCPTPTLRLESAPSCEVTWKEVKESSVSSLMKRRVPRACSSITKAKMTSWVPSRGMRVSVDLASLVGAGWKCNSAPFPRTLLPFLYPQPPPRPGIWVTDTLTFHIL